VLNAVAVIEKIPMAEIEHASLFPYASGYFGDRKQSPTAVHDPDMTQNAEALVEALIGAGSSVHAEEDEDPASEVVEGGQLVQFMEPVAEV